MGTQEYPKVRIRYEGPAGSHTVIGLATRTKYGRHEKGDVFWVHRADIDANPEYFTVLGDADGGGSLVESLPKTPEQVRAPKPIRLPSEEVVVREEINQWAQQAAVSPAVEAELRSEELRPDWMPESVQTSDPAGKPANLITLDEIGVSERISALLAGVGLIAVSDVVGLIQRDGEEALREIEGIGKGSVKEIVTALRQHGYLEAG